MHFYTEFSDRQFLKKFLNSDHEVPLKGVIDYDNTRDKY